MEKCPKCGSSLNTDEKASGRCFNCGTIFESSLPITSNNEYISNKTNNVCFFLCVMSVVTFVICLLIFIGTKQEYIIEKGNVASEKINSISIYNLNPDVNTDALDKLVIKRTMCIIGIVISIMIGIISAIILKSPSTSNNNIKPQINNIDDKNIKYKLQELQSLLESNLITEEEFLSKKKEILDKM